MSIYIAHYHLKNLYCAKCASSVRIKTSLTVVWMVRDWGRCIWSNPGVRSIMVSVWILWPDSSKYNNNNNNNTLIYIAPACRMTSEALSKYPTLRTRDTLRGTRDCSLDMPSSVGSHDKQSEMDWVSFARRHAETDIWAPVVLDQCWQSALHKGENTLWTAAAQRFVGQPVGRWLIVCPWPPTTPPRPCPYNSIYAFRLWRARAGEYMTRLADSALYTFLGQSCSKQDGGHMSQTPRPVLPGRIEAFVWFTELDVLVFGDDK